MTNARDIIIRPLVTEKTIKTEETQNTVVFEVAKKANKIAIKQAIEEIFKVKVESVNTANVKPKTKRDVYKRQDQGYQESIYQVS